MSDFSFQPTRSRQPTICSLVQNFSFFPECNSNNVFAANKKWPLPADHADERRFNCNSNKMFAAKERREKSLCCFFFALLSFCLCAP